MKKVDLFVGGVDMRLFWLALVLVALAVVAPRQIQGQVPVQLASSRKSLPPGGHGGHLFQNSGLNVETCLGAAGLNLYLQDREGKPVSVARMRGVVMLKKVGAARRFRFDVLPSGGARLTARSDLSRFQGQQLEVEVMLVGTSKNSPAQQLRYRALVRTPPSEIQLAAASIARQKICPVTSRPLGSMGQPVAVKLTTGTVYVCCRACVEKVAKDPEKFRTGKPQFVVSTSTAADADLIQTQKICPVMDEPLGGMGTPVKVLVGQRPVFLCCRGCIKRLKADPAKYLAMLAGENQTKQ